MIQGLSFSTSTPPVSTPARMDVACFIGYVRRRRPEPSRLNGRRGPRDFRPVPAFLRAWFDAYGWRPGSAGRTVQDLAALRDVPVPIDTWEAFDALFDWSTRPIAYSRLLAETAMGAAVRRFFASGGRSCYVVRLGDPWAVHAPWPERAGRITDYLPALPPPTPVDRETWRGLGHLLGLPDVSFVCLPDLPELFAREPSDLVPEPVDVPREAFVECAEALERSERETLRGIPVPGCDADGFWRWARFVNEIADFLRYQSRYAGEAQLVAAVPLPLDVESLAGMRDAARTVREARTAQWEEASGIHTRYVQLAYPWLRTNESRLLPGGVESPAPLLVGALADNALSRGTWSSIIRRDVPGVVDTEPVQGLADLNKKIPPPSYMGPADGAPSVRDRVTLIGPSPRGHRFTSDVTTAAERHESLHRDESYRPASVTRLLATILREAQVIGQEMVFENNGEILWRRLRAEMVHFLAALWDEGALGGATAEEAFQVQCDRSTMTQADIDAGRLLARIAFTAAVPIVHINVILALEEGGQISLLSPRTQHIASAAAL